MLGQLAGLGISTATAFRARTVPGVSPAGLPEQAWDLDRLRARYDHFISQASALCERAGPASCRRTRRWSPGPG